MSHKCEHLMLLVGTKEGVDQAESILTRLSCADWICKQFLAARMLSCFALLS